ncbi:conserved hypothetical protein [Trichinella spiralis]|uniref:hypothetical protein n=1 Tax=Trichinella spiralis TaxID=6334 RepID=UPI0001EFBFD8|nr:conserved hypothetical protein [Trichinella spiralis]
MGTTEFNDDEQMINFNAVLHAQLNNSVKFTYHLKIEHFKKSENFAQIRTKNISACCCVYRETNIFRTMAGLARRSRFYNNNSDKKSVAVMIGNLHICRRFVRL